MWRAFMKGTISLTWTLCERNTTSQVWTSSLMLSCELNGKQNWPLGQIYAFQVDKFGGIGDKGLQITNN